MDIKVTCKQRIAKMIYGVGENKLVALGLLDWQKVRDRVRCPTGLLKRKMKNSKRNGGTDEVAKEGGDPVNGIGMSKTAQNSKRKADGSAEDAPTNTKKARMSTGGQSAPSQTCPQGATEDLAEVYGGTARSAFGETCGENLVQKDGDSEKQGASMPTNMPSDTVGDVPTTRTAVACALVKAVHALSNSSTPQVATTRSTHLRQNPVQHMLSPSNAHDPGEPDHTRQDQRGLP